MAETYTARDYFTCPKRPGFLAWGLKVDEILQNTLDMGVLDLPDQDYSAMYADGMRPSAVVAKIIDDMCGY